MNSLQARSRAVGVCIHVASPQPESPSLLICIVANTLSPKLIRHIHKCVKQVRLCAASERDGDWGSGRGADVPHLQGPSVVRSLDFLFKIQQFRFSLEISNF